MRNPTITVAWPAVPNVPGYDLYENDTKVSSTSNTSARFGVSNGMVVKIVAQAIPAPPPPPPARHLDANFGGLKVGDVATAVIVNG